MKQVALFGGSFDPPHMGHIFIVCYLALQNFDEILVLPSFKHPEGKNLSPFVHRLEMTKLAMDWIPSVTVSDFERKIATNDKFNYTVDTVNKLLAEHADWRLHLVVGSDISDFSRWERGDELISKATPFIVGRAPATPGVHPILLPNISSTEIRASLKKQLNHHIAKAYLPPNVLHYAETHNLYQPQRF